MSLDRLKNIINEINITEESLDNFLSGLNVDRLTDYLISNVKQYLDKPDHRNPIAGMSHDHVKVLIENSILDLKGNLQGKTSLILYRSLVLDVDINTYLKDTDSLGVYWSLSSKGAKPYWRETGGKEYLITAEANPEHIDWQGTIITNILFPREKEIRLKKGTPMKLKAVRSREGTREKVFSDLKNKEYKA